MKPFLPLAILFFSTLIRSTFGFGDALLAMPLLTLVLGLTTATPLVALAAFTIALTILLKEWRHVQVKSAWRLILASMLGVPLGLYFLKGNYESVMKVILASVIILFSLYQLYKPTLIHLKSEASAFLFGFIAGILGGAYNTNGPPVVIYGSLRRWPKETFRVTLQGYFFVNGFVILGGHAAAGLWTMDVLRLFLMALPVVLSAVWLGGRLHRKIPGERFHRTIYGLLFIVGLFLLIRTV